MYTCTVLLSVAIIAFSYKYGNHLLYMYSTSQCGNHCLFIPIWQSPPIHVHCTVLLSLRQSLSTFFDDNHCTFLLVATNCISPEAFTFLIYFLCGNHLSYLTGMTSSLWEYKQINLSQISYKKVLKTLVLGGVTNIFFSRISIRMVKEGAHLLSFINNVASSGVPERPHAFNVMKGTYLKNIFMGSSGSDRLEVVILFSRGRTRCHWYNSCSCSPKGIIVTYIYTV